MSALEMRVNMDCAGCVSKIRKALKKVEGVDDVDMDMEMQKVTVMGWADQEKIFKAIRKTGRNVELWPYPYTPEPMNYYQYYYRQPQPVIVQTQPINNYYAPPDNSNTSYQYDNQYNYYYNEENYGYYRRPPYSRTTVDNEQASNVFSDENPHACSIM